MVDERVTYERSIFGRRDEILERVLRDSLGEGGMPTIQVDDGAGRFLAVVASLLQPKRVLEIGTLFGYSTIYIARALSPSATFLSLEIDPVAADLARSNVAKAGLSHVVQVVTTDATVFLQNYSGELFDYIFIDGEKRSYPQYLKACYPLLSVGGVLIADDAYATGDFSPETDHIDDAREGISTYARAIARAPHLRSAMVGTQTGMLVSVKGPSL